jgi:hypothetical protein
MSRHAVKISARPYEARQVDLLAALELVDERAQPWRPAALALVIPPHYTLLRTYCELASLACALPLLWLTRRKLRG